MRNKNGIEVGERINVSSVWPILESFQSYNTLTLLISFISLFLFVFYLILKISHLNKDTEARNYI